LGDRRRCRAIGLVVVLLAAVQFALMAHTQAGRRWYPTLDQAMIELLMRDVGTENSPTTGLVGRFVFEEMQASHPGPLSWYVLSPAYRLLGSTGSALIVSNLLLGFLAVVAVVWMVARRGDPTRLLIVGVAVVLLARALGTVILSEVWNPHLPVLWFLVAVVASWSVLVGSRPLVLLAVFAGSLCAQTHISYSVPVAALLMLTLGALVVDAVRHANRRLRDLAWLAAGVGALVVLWVPTIYDQLTHDPGNLWLLWSYFTDEAEEPIGFTEGLDVVLVHLDPWRFVTGRLWGDRQSALPGVPSGSATPGAVLLIVWLLAVVASWRFGDRALRRWHLVAGVTLAASIYATTRIVPPVWYWVVLFLWVLQVMVLIGCGWTVAACLAGVRDPRRRHRLLRAGRGAALVAIAMIGVVWVGETLTGPRLTDQPQSEVLAALVPEAVEVLRTGTAPGGGLAGRYLVRWSEPVGLGSGGYGFLDELERAGFDVVADELQIAQVRPHRVAEPDEADKAAEDRATTAIVELVGGAAIARRLALPGAVQVAYTDLRTDDERTRFNTLRSELINRVAPDLDLLGAIDDNVVAMMFRSDLDPEVIALAGEMVGIGVPMAVVVRPPEAPQPG